MLQLTDLERLGSKEGPRKRSRRHLLGGLGTGGVRNLRDQVRE